MTITWKPAPPPSPGWWNVALNKPPTGYVTDWWGWWDGKTWLHFAHESCKPHEVTQINPTPSQADFRSCGLTTTLTHAATL